MKLISQVPGQRAFVLDEFPNAAKAVRVPGPLAQRLSDLCMHSDDLSFANDSLDLVQSSPIERAREVAWRSAITHYVKCFSSSNAARKGNLDLRKILPNDSVANTAHCYFVNLRNKHLAHDENAFSQCVVMSVVNDETRFPKVEVVRSILMRVETFSQESFLNLRHLVFDTLKWVEAQIIEVADLLKAELEQLSTEQLLGMDAVDFTAPHAHQVGETREPIHGARRKPGRG